MVNKVKNLESATALKAVVNHEEIGDAHFMSSINTPLREDAFELSDEEKMSKIEEHFTGILETLGLDLTDDSLKGTPKRMAKMYVKEIFQGLNPENKPRVSLFDNKYQYGEMLIERDITFHSCCEHHLVPFIGKAHVAYISNGSVIGLSKINRLVQYFAQRPQVQERLTIQIAEELKRALNTKDIAIVMEAEHMCVSTRGVKDCSSSTVTSSYHGKFKNENLRKEFLSYLNK